jgi:hypothetical protein
MNDRHITLSKHHKTEKEITGYHGSQRKSLEIFKIFFKKKLKRRREISHKVPTYL